MIDFFDFFYSSVIDTKGKFLKKLKLYSAFLFSIRLLINLIAPVYFVWTKGGGYSLVNSGTNNGRIIVSLTSYPTRISRTWLVIETILRQTQKPYKIILWLSIEQFSTLDQLPKRLLKQMERGLEIRLVEGDIHSHKKYYYTLQEFPNDYMLTIDDDIFYRSTMIEDLVNYSRRFPNTVISQYCTRIRWTGDRLESYISWSKIKEETNPNLLSFFGSGGGTLFPPHMMDPEVLNMKLFMFITPFADDVWLNAMCRLKGTKIVSTRYHTHFLPLLYLSNKTLSSINNGLNQNDFQILAIREYFIKNKKLDPFSQSIE